MAASFSYADSRSITSVYFALFGDACTDAASCSAGAGAISDCGARSRVHATGVGAPFSFITVTTASPMPSWVSTSSRSYDEFGKVDTVAFSALASFGVCARSWCCTREPSCASTSSGTSFGVWVTKKTPTPLDRISRTVCAIASRNAFDASVEQQVRLVEEEHQLRLVHVADLGQVVEQVGQQPHQEGGEQRRPVLQVRQLEQRDDALAVALLHQVGGVELRLAEERLGALVGEPDQRPQDHPGGGRGQPAEVLQVGLALVAGQVL